MKSNNKNENSFEVISCHRCGYQLGCFEADEVSIRIKDQYLYFCGGMLRIVCRGCGSSNLVVQTKFASENSELTAKAKQIPGCREAKYRPWVERSKFQEQPKKEQDKNV